MLYRHTEDGAVQEESEVVGIRNLLLRGCILKNTEFVYGAVVSAGEDTKVEFTTKKKNSWDLKVCAARGAERLDGGHKVAMLTQRLNSVIYLMVVMLVILCSVVAAGGRSEA